MTREEAIRVLEDNRPSVIFEDIDAQKRMEELCQALDMAIEALSAEDAVDVNEVTIHYKPYPSADAVHGEWINRENCQVDEDAYEVATCSNCKSEITIEYPYDNFCPNCGCVMI